MFINCMTPKLLPWIQPVPTDETANWQINGHRNLTTTELDTKHKVINNSTL